MFVWLSRTGKKRELIWKKAWDGVERPKEIGQWVKLSYCRSQDASFLKHSVELKVQLLTGRLKGAGRRGVRAVLFRRSPVNRPRTIYGRLVTTGLQIFCSSQFFRNQRQKYKLCREKHVSLLGLFTGEWCFHPPCWEQKELPFSCRNLQRRHRRTPIWPSMRIPWVSFVHYSRFLRWKNKTKTCIQGAKRPTTRGNLTNAEGTQTRNPGWGAELYSIHFIHSQFKRKLVGFF